MTRKREYPPEELCLARRRNEDGPCQNPRRSCLLHCNADTRDGGRCPTAPNANTLRCRMHGGTQAIAAGNPNFRHGLNSRYSSVLTGTSIERFEEAMNDPAYMESREEIALLDTMLMDALDRSQIGHQGEMWEELGSRAHQYQVALRRGDPVHADNHLQTILEIAEEGALAHRATIEARDIIERKRKVKDSERKRIVDENQSISAARAMALVGAVVATVRKHLEGREDGRELLAAISADLTALIHADVTGGSRGT